MRTQIRRFPAALRRLNHRRSLAILFLAFLAAVSATTFPQSLTNLGEALREPRALPQGLTEPLDDLYREMLDFKSPVLTNKGSYINLNGLIARLMGQRYMNERVKLDNGHLTELSKREDTTLACERITALCNQQRSNGKAFLFVFAPMQIDKHESLLPDGYQDYANENGDALLAGLRANGVPVLDLRDVMREEGLNYDDAFFVTDHHWKPEVGFWAYTKILGDLEKQGIIPPVDPMYTDLNHFDVKIYSQWALGSAGKRTGKYYAGVDDFSIITPQFETHLVTEIASKGEKRVGTFAEAALNWERVRKRDYYSEIPYSFYGFGSLDRMQYQNEHAPVHQKLLWLGDSFGNVVAPFLSLAFRTVEDMDMRHYRQDFAAFFAGYQPDIVIMLINAGIPVQENTTHDYFPIGEAAL